MTWVVSNLVSIRLEMVLVSLQDRSTVCAKRTIGSEIVLDAPDGTIGDGAQVEARFGPFGDIANPNEDRCMVCAEHTIGLDIVLDALNGTPR